MTLSPVARQPGSLRTPLRPSAGRPVITPAGFTPGMSVRATVRAAPARPAGTWTSWAIALPGAGWEEHDEQAVWEEIDD